MVQKKTMWDTLTEEEREEYVNQDYIGKQGLFYNTDITENLDIKNNVWSGVNLDNPNILKRVIIGLFIDDKTVKEIGCYVPCSIRYVQMVIKDWKEKQRLINNKNEVKKDLNS